MSEIIDKGSWVSAATLVFIVSAAFFASVNTKLNDVYRIPDFYEFYQPTFGSYNPDPNAAATQHDQAVANYQDAMSSRQIIPFVGDRFFKLFSFDPYGFYMPLVSLSIFYVPTVILLMSIFAAVGNFGVVLRRDYGTLATCTLMAWAAAHLPFALAGAVLYSQPVDVSVYLSLWLASGLLFGILMVFVIRTVFGANYGVAVVVVSIAWISLSLGMYVFEYVSPWLLSPFLLFFVFMYFGGYLGGEVRGFGNAFRQKQNLKRFLHNATVNPKDADAHVQLGLIYLGRRQETRALEHLNKAIEIDPDEIDANYELGKIARAKGSLQEALDHFSKVVEQNDKHALSEVWREIGATYLEAGMFNEAQDALEKFVDRRAFDTEGLYYLGKTLKSLGQTEKAREMFEQAVESAKTSPDFRRSNVRYWSKLAQKEI